MTTVKRKTGAPSIVVIDKIVGHGHGLGSQVGHGLGHGSVIAGVSGDTGGHCVTIQYPTIAQIHGNRCRRKSSSFHGHPSVSNVKPTLDQLANGHTVTFDIHSSNDMIANETQHSSDQITI